MNAVGPALLVVVGLLQLSIDGRVWGTRLTPGVLLIGGYVGVALTHALASLAYPFNPVALTTYVVLAVLGLCVAGVSVLVGAVVGWHPSEARRAPSHTGAGLRWALVIMIALYGGLAARAARASGGLWSFGSHDALAGGLLGHANVLLVFLTVCYAASSTDRLRTRAALIGASVLAISLNPVKGWTVIALMALALAHAFRRGGSLKPLVLASLAGVGVFFSIYLARALSAGISISLAAAAVIQIFPHLLFYLTAGLFGMNAVVAGLRLPGGPLVLAAPLLNAVALATDDPFVPVLSNTYVIGLLEHGDGGNVFSFFGSLIAYSGPMIGVAAALLVIALAYFAFAWGWRTQLVAAHAGALYITAVLAFGWFDYYFWLLTPIEVLVLAAGASILEAGVSAQMRHIAQSVP